VVHGSASAPFHRQRVLRALSISQQRHSLPHFPTVVPPSPPTGDRAIPPFPTATTRPAWRIPEIALSPPDPAWRTPETTPFTLRHRGHRIPHTRAPAWRIHSTNARNGAACVHVPTGDQAIHHRSAPTLIILASPRRYSRQVGLQGGPPLTAPRSPRPPLGPRRDMRLPSPTRCSLLRTSQSRRSTPPPCCDPLPCVPMMLEGKSYLVPRSLLSSCEIETQWAYFAHEVHGGKRLAPEDCEVEDLDKADVGGKRSKPPSPQPHTPDISEGRGSSRHASGCGEQQGTGSNPMNSIDRDLTLNSLLRTIE
jgi:hypothetical protein